MSKLVIHTQYRENYGDAEFPRWKGKGGEVYVLPNLSQDDLNDVNYIAVKISEKIEYFSEMTEEYVINWSVEEDSAVAWDEWETPWTVVRQTDGMFIERFVKSSHFWNGDYEGKFEKRPIGMGSVFDPDSIIVQYVKKETA